MENQLRSKRNHAKPIFLPTPAPSEGWYHLLQKLAGRSVNPGLQMFGQSISGNVDMDGNGYAGPVRAQQHSASCVTLPVA